MSSDSMQGFEVVRGRVLPEWIDINDHMNVAYYVLAFDQAVDKLWADFGLSDDYIRTHCSSTFAVESHVTWQREIAEAEPYIVTSQILAYDEKRIHQFQRLYHATEGYLSATCEWMNLHVDTRTRRVAPWPAEILANIEKFAASQGPLPWPAEAGKRMQVRNPLYSARSEGS